MDYKIIQVYEHYNIYINNEFYCSADTWSDAIREIKNYEEILPKEKGNGHFTRETVKEV